MKSWDKLVLESTTPITITKTKGNWKLGKIGNEYSFEAMVFGEGSDDGIDGGKISKLFLKDNGGKVVADYERGYDKKPSGTIKNVWDKLVDYLENN